MWHRGVCASLGPICPLVAAYYYKVNIAVGRRGKYEDPPLIPIKMATCNATEDHRSTKRGIRGIGRTC